MNKEIINTVVFAVTTVAIIKLDAYHNPFGRSAKMLKKLCSKKKK